MMKLFVAPISGEIIEMIVSPALLILDLMKFIEQDHGYNLMSQSLVLGTQVLDKVTLSLADYSVADGDTLALVIEKVDDSESSYASMPGLISSSSSSEPGRLPAVHDSGSSSDSDSDDGSDIGLRIYYLDRMD